jgi:prepilin-type N-terminal cleavage/methylation domain-containing protein
MFRHYPKRTVSRRQRRGLTLLELLIAMGIMLLVVGALETLAQAVHQAFEYNEGHGMATQHARVVLDRITRTVNEATANEQFPGFLVLADTVATWTFPDTLVVWHPTGQPADAAGLPRYGELVIYCPDAYIPNQLLEITLPGDTRVTPAVTDQAAWASALSTIKQGRQGNRVVLTDLLRTCTTSTGGSSGWRGAVRFASQVRPSDSEWAQFKAGTLAWKNLPWVQTFYGAKTGLRQSWLRMELQLMPGKGIVAPDAASQQPVPFFGSAALYYEMNQ